jgi:hypothetical protein
VAKRKFLRRLVEILSNQPLLWLTSFPWINQPVAMKAFRMKKYIRVMQINFLLRAIYKPSKANESLKDTFLPKA